MSEAAAAADDEAPAPEPPPNGMSCGTCDACGGGILGWCGCRMDPMGGCTTCPCAIMRFWAAGARMGYCCWCCICAAIMAC